VNVAHGEAGAFNIDREKDARTAAEVFDVAIASMFPGRDGAGGFQRGAFGLVLGHASQMRGVGIGQGREGRHPFRVGGDELRLALVPGVEKLLRGQAADEPGMHDPGKFNPGDL